MTPLVFDAWWRARMRAAASNARPTRVEIGADLLHGFSTADDRPTWPCVWRGEYDRSWAGRGGPVDEG